MLSCLQYRALGEEASRCYELSAQTHDVFLESFEQRDVLASITNTQMTSEATATRLDYKGLAETSPASAPKANRQGGGLKAMTEKKCQPLQEPQFAAFVGIDWADQKHAWCLQAVNSGKRESG